MYLGNRKLSEEEVRLFENIGLEKSEIRLMNDLARNAASKAIESIDLVAKLVPRAHQAEIVRLMACLMVGEAAREIIDERVAETVAWLDQHVKKPRTAGIRDFDGNTS